jgi:hypothetical protein
VEHGSEMREKGADDANEVIKDEYLQSSSIRPARGETANEKPSGTRADVTCT